VVDSSTTITTDRVHCTSIILTFITIWDYLLIFMLFFSTIQASIVINFYFKRFLLTAGINEGNITHKIH